MDKQPYRVIVWCAVSSKQQATEDKASLPAQETEGSEFAQAVGGAVVDVLTVPGHSRDVVLFEEAAQQMEAYRQLREHVEAQDFDVLWARDPDRLGRDPALAQTVASLVERSGAEVYCASAPHVLGEVGAGQRYVYAIQSVRAGEDQRKRVRYHEMGMRRRVESGLPSGRLAYGYKPVRDHLTGRVVGAELSEEAEAVRIATRMFIRGEPYTSIAKALDASPYRPPVAEHWRPRTVWRWMFIDTYAGVASWRKYATTGQSSRFPALWDDATYRAVLRERQNRNGGHYRKRESSPLLDVAFCARCGGRMVQCANSAGVLWLRCGTHHRKRRTGRTCHANNIKLDVAVDAVVSFLAGMTDLDTLNAHLAEGVDRDALRSRLEDIAHQLDGCDGKRKRLALAYAADAMDLRVYREADDHVLAEAEALEAEGAGIQAELSRSVDPVVRLEDIQEIAEVLRDSIAVLPGIEVSTALRNIGLRIEIEEGQVTRCLFA